MADFLDMVSGNEPAPAEPEPIATPEPEPVAEAPAPEPEAPEVTADPVPDRPEPGYIPIAAMMDERDKRRALEKELEQFRSKQVEAPAIPDPFDDPQGYAGYVQQQIDERTTAVTFQISERFAKQAHGEEAVQKAIEWGAEKAKADPSFAMGYMRDSDPIGWIVQQHKRDALLSDIGDNPDDWFTREAAKRGYVVQSATEPAAAPAVAMRQPAPRAPVPPRSIASDATPASATPTSGSYNVFDGLLPG